MATIINISNTNRYIAGERKGIRQLNFYSCHAEWFAIKLGKQVRKN
jgi:hypothetical protein